MTYDAVVVLGSRPIQPGSWSLPSHVYDSLDRAAKLLAGAEARYIIASGKWTINFDVLGIHQPFSECDAMAEYLTGKGTPAQKILREGESKDTISNFYYIKQLITEPNQLHSLHFIAAEPRLERISFLARRILGPDYELSFEGVAHADGEVSPNEQRTLRKQAAFLEPMADGDHAWLDGKFYDDPFYAAVKRRVEQRAQLEPFLSLATRLPKQ